MLKLRFWQAPCVSNQSVSVGVGNNKDGINQWSYETET